MCGRVKLTATEDSHAISMAVRADDPALYKTTKTSIWWLEFYSRYCWVNMLDNGGGIEEGEQGGDFVAVSFFSLGGNHLVKGAEVDRVLLNPPYVSKVIT